MADTDPAPAHPAVLSLDADPRNAAWIQAVESLHLTLDDIRDVLALLAISVADFKASEVYREGLRSYPQLADL